MCSNGEPVGVQLTTDGHRAYLAAVEATFGPEIDYAILVHIYGRNEGQTETRHSPAECLGTRKMIVQSDPDPAKISTSYVERQYLSIRIGMRPFTRLTNAFSKRIEKHVAMLALYFLHYTFCRIHKTPPLHPGDGGQVGYDRSEPGVDRRAD